MYVQPESPKSFKDDYAFNWASIWALSKQIFSLQRTKLSRKLAIYQNIDESF